MDGHTAPIELRDRILERITPGEAELRAVEEFCERTEGELLDALVDVQRRLEKTRADLKCVERENIHITLRFLGDVRKGLVGELKRLVSGIAFEPFHVEFRGLGVFPNLRRPRIVWVGMSDGCRGA